MRNARLGLLVGIAASALTLVSCTTAEPAASPTGSVSATPSVTVKVGADNSNQSQILANLYVGALNAAGQPAELRSLGDSEPLISAVEDDEAQIVADSVVGAVEVLNAQLNGAGATTQVSSDLDAEMNNLRGLASEKELTVLNPADASDELAFAVRKVFAKANGLTSLSDLADYSQDAPLVVGGPADCRKDPLCLPSLVNTYGAKVRKFQTLDAGGPLTTAALAAEKIDVGVFGSFDSALDPPDFVVLIDDRDVQPAGNIVPILTDRAKSQLVSETLNNLSAQLKTIDLRAMNYAVEVQEQDPAEVADAWLTVNGLA